MDRLDRAVEEIISELHCYHLREVPSSEIGKKVIEKLYAIDPVAYIRYVSVYRQFSNVEEFIQEITQMRHQTLIDPLQEASHSLISCSMIGFRNNRPLLKLGDCLITEYGEQWLADALVARCPACRNNPSVQGRPAGFRALLSGA